MKQEQVVVPLIWMQTFQVIRRYRSNKLAIRSGTSKTHNNFLAVAQTTIKAMQLG